MERNLLEREIAALQGAEHFFTYIPWFTTPKVAAPIMYQTKLRGKVAETSFLRQADLKTKEKINGKDVYYLPNQWVEVLGENGDWFLVEGEAFYTERKKEKKSSSKLQGYIKKSWVIYKIPAKLDEEPKSGKPPSEYICYVDIDLNLKANQNNKAYEAVKKDNKWISTAWVIDFPEQLTAIYVPNNFKPDLETDMIIYLHGHLNAYPGLKNAGSGKNSKSIKEYLDYSLPTDFTKSFTTSKGNSIKSYFDFRSMINDSGKNVIFVAPTLGPRSQYGNLAVTFDNYVDQVIWAINEYVFKERSLAGKFKLRNLIVAAHSGGGSAMLKIAQQTKSVYVKRVKEYWGFDAWYNSSWSWNVIAKNKSVIIYAYPYDSWGTPTEDKKTVFVTDAGKDANLTKLMGKGESRHFALLPYYFEERLGKL